MLDRATLKESRDERAFRKAMEAGKAWTFLTCNLYLTEDEKCYFEIEKNTFFTKDSKREAEWDLLDRGECAWSDFAFEHWLSPKWMKLVEEHKADEYFVDDWQGMDDHELA